MSKTRAKSTGRTFVVAQVAFSTDTQITFQRAAAYQRLAYTSHCNGANDKIVYVGKDGKEQDKSNAVRCPRVSHFRMGLYAMFFNSDGSRSFLHDRKALTRRS